MSLYIFLDFMISTDMIKVKYYSEPTVQNTMHTEKYFPFILAPRLNNRATVPLGKKVVLITCTGQLKHIWKKKEEAAREERKICALQLTEELNALSSTLWIALHITEH